MKIDNRKVNGRIPIEPSDTVDGLKILIYKPQNSVHWTTGFTKDNSMIQLSPAVAAAYLQNALRTVQAIRFIIMTVDMDGVDVWQFPVYRTTMNRDTISIDIDAIMAGKKLKITVLTGEIALVDNT